MTVCTHGGKCILGEVHDGEITLSSFGDIVSACWQLIPEHFQRVILDSFIVMPNHLQGILMIEATDDELAGGIPDPSASATNPLPDFHQRGHLKIQSGQKGSLGSIVGSFKSASTRQFNALRQRPGQTLWQQNYYEHIIRDERPLDRIRQYIEANPSRSPEDEENPARFANRL